VRNQDRELAQNSPLVCGVDEVGRGAIAGPVVAAAVVLPTDFQIPGVNDSKLLTPKQRAALFPVIKHRALSTGIGAVGILMIERENIANATFQAMRRAIDKALAKLNTVKTQKVVVLADGWQIPDLHLPCIGIKGGDRQSLAIACASIVAKVFRDQLMKRYDYRFPGYDFARHKGYGTPQHLAALQTLGISPIHRRTFEPVRRLLTQNHQFLPTKQSELFSKINTRHSI